MVAVTDGVMRHAVRHGHPRDRARRPRHQGCGQRYRGRPRVAVRNLRSAHHRRPGRLLLRRTSQAHPYCAHPRLRDRLARRRHRHRPPIISDIAPIRVFTAVYTLAFLTFAFGIAIQNWGREDAARIRVAQTEPPRHRPACRRPPAPRRPDRVRARRRGLGRYPDHCR